MSAGRLGSLYNLSPATIAGLANVTGEAAPDAAEWGYGNPNAPPAEQVATATAPPGAPTKFDSKGYAITGNTTPEMIAERTGEPEAPVSAAAPGASRAASVDPYSAGYGASASPARTVPAHWQPGSHSVGLQHGMAPSELEQGASERDVATGYGLMAADKHLEAAQKAGMADAVYASAHQMASQQANERISQLNRDRDNYVATERKKLDQLAAETQKEVDPNAYWKERGSGAQLAAALMIGLNEFATLWRGRGTNTAKALIDEGIARNIDAQKTNISNARNALTGRESIYARNLAAFGDQERATLATKVNYLDQVSAMADAKRAEVKTDEAQAGHDELVKHLYDERAQAADKFAQLTHTQATEQMNEHFVPPQTVGGASQLKREGDLVTLSDGTTFKMGSEKIADKAVEKIQVLDKLQRRNNDILKLRAEAVKLDPILDATEFAKKKALLEEYADEKVALMSIGLEQGTVKEDEYKRAKEFAANAENGLGFFKGNPYAAAQRESADAVLRMQTKKWGDDQRSYVTSAGGSVYQRGYVKDQNGNLKPVGRYTGQDATPTEALPPNGAKAMDSHTELPTAGAPVRTKIPAAKRFDLPDGKP